jgi:ribosomal protein L11 methyltransferase
MSWLKLTIDTPAGQVEALTALLEQFATISISLHPVSDEQLYADVDEPQVFWRDTSVSALLDSDTDIDILVACIRNRIGTENIKNYRMELLADREWIEACKDGYEPMVFSGKLQVRPGWIEPSPEYQHDIIMDPGLAFGTGKHNTTSLCLEWLANYDIRRKSVIDYGCGSGILGLAAARLGAAKVYAVDIDPQAITATRANAARNNLAEKLAISLAGKTVLPPVDLLLANILLNPLLDLMPVFSKLVKPGGQLVLSGILANQVKECQAMYADCFDFLAPQFSDEWALLHGFRLALSD